MKRLLVIFILFLNISLYANNIELTTLEKQNLLEWTNQHCYENHLNYESLLKDRYFLCEGTTRDYPGGLKGDVCFKKVVHSPWTTALVVFLFVFVIMFFVIGISWLLINTAEEKIIKWNGKDKFYFLSIIKSRKKLFIPYIIIGLIVAPVIIGLFALKESSINTLRNGELEDVKIMLPVINYFFKDNKNGIVLRLAVSNGRVDIVKYLIEEKNYNPNISIKAKYKYEKTPLDLALRNRSYDIANYLKQYLPNDKPVDITIASKSFDLELLKQSVKLANPTIDELLDGFLTSIEYKDNEAMEYIYNLNPTIIEKEGKRSYVSKATPLMVAIKSNNVEAVKFLVSKNVKFNECGILSNAAFYDRLEIFTFLIENGADINLKCKNKYHNVFLQANRGKAKRVKKFIENKGYVETKIKN